MACDSVELESCDFEIVTPSCAAISSARRASVQLIRFVTGADKRGAATSKAACVFTGAGPGKGLVSAPQPDRVFPNAERLGDPCARPTPKRQKHGPRPVRLGPVRPARLHFERRHLLSRRRNRRFPRHVPSPNHSVGRNQKPAALETRRVGNPPQICHDQAMASDHLEDIYPLSPLQQGILFHTLHDPTSPAYFEQSSCRFQGPVDVPVFECAWQRLVDRHAVLRTAFVWERVADPVQVVRRRVPLPLAREDWRGVAEVEQQSRLEEYLARDRKKGFKLSQAPLMRLALIRLAEQSYEFVWSYHHLLLDGWSAALLLDEFSEFYSVLIRGEEPHPEPTRPYRDFIAWLHRQDQAAAKAYWQRALGDFSSPTPLPADRAREVPGERAATGEERQVWLSSGTTTALQRFAQQQSLTLNTLVQATWARLLSHHSGEQDVVFGVTVSGRPADIPGVETMVGLFINTLPMRVRISPAERVRPWLRGTPEAATGDGGVPIQLARAGTGLERRAPPATPF